MTREAMRFFYEYHIVRLQRIQERLKLALLGGVETAVTVAGSLAFAVMQADGLIQVSGASVMQVRSAGAHAPERRGFHLVGVGIALLDAIVERSHVMQ